MFGVVLFQNNNFGIDNTTYEYSAIYYYNQLFLNVSSMPLCFYLRKLYTFVHIMILQSKSVEFSVTRTAVHGNWPYEIGVKSG